MNQKIIGFFQTLGFKPLNADPSIIISNRDRAILIISVYVDDFLLASNNPQAFQWPKSGISNEYNVKDLGEVRTIIGWQFTRDRTARTLKINQSSFTQDLIESENITDCNSVSIPMKACCFIEMSEPGDYEKVDIKPYQRLIGKLMYLSCGTRSDIAFVVGQLSKYNLDTKDGRMKAVKKVVRYLKGEMHLGLVHGSQPQSKTPTAPSPFGIIGYGDSSYAGDP